MKLHEAIETILKEAGNPLKPAEIAARINARNLYTRGDGKPVPYNQISLRVRNYSSLFVKRIDGTVALSNWSGKEVSAPKRIPKTYNTVKGFPPFVPEGAEILVLGTMPGVESLQKQEYYAKNGNAFWKIISHLYQDGLPFFTYKEKLDCLEAHHIALWDTLQFCERKGSLDSDITNGVPNDIDGLLTMFPTIRKIVFNGKKAASIYQPHIKSYIAISTSGAATKSFEEKLNDWKKALR